MTDIQCPKARMGRISFVVIYLIACTVIVFSQTVTEHVLSMTSGVYCTDHILKKFSSSSVGQCAVACNEDYMCVAFSHQEEQCFLHSRFCDVNSLPSAEGSRYSGKQLLDPYALTPLPSSSLPPL